MDQRSALGAIIIERYGQVGLRALLLELSRPGGTHAETLGLLDGEYVELRRRLRADPDAREYAEGSYRK